MGSEMCIRDSIKRAFFRARSNDTGTDEKTHDLFQVELEIVPLGNGAADGGNAEHGKDLPRKKVAHIERADRIQREKSRRVEVESDQLFFGLPHSLDLHFENGFDFFSGRDAVFFHKRREIAQRLPIAGGALLGERVGIVFLDIVADAAFGRSGMKTNGHKLSLIHI